MINLQAIDDAVGADFHCHLDLYPEHIALIGECEKLKILTLTVTTTPKAWPRNRELTESCSYVQAALGLHPQLVSERANELPLFEKHLAETRFVGEIGLDAGSRFYSSFAEQEAIFSRILSMCAEQRNKILTIHSVRSVSKVLKHLEKNLLPFNGRVILHWFTGTENEVRKAADIGCYFSINDEMLKSQKHRNLILQLPLDRILTETDGPFIQRAGKPIRPAQSTLTCVELSKVRGLEPYQMKNVILKNAKELLAYI